VSLAIPFLIGIVVMGTLSATYFTASRCVCCHLVCWVQVRTGMCSRWRVKVTFHASWHCYTWTHNVHNWPSSWRCMCHHSLPYTYPAQTFLGIALLFIGSLDTLTDMVRVCQ
jgi:hypothetical protein